MINKAIFPVAGLGTRFLPATKANPKEMLAVVDKPLIQYAVEEAYEAGIREMIFVTGRHKRAIEDHFDFAYELNDALLAAEKHELAHVIDSVCPADMKCIYLRQPKALGLGHAIWCARPLIRDEAFAVVLADDLMVGSPNVLAQMVKQYEQEQCSIVAVEEIPKELSYRYGIVDILTELRKGGVAAIEHLVEKPKPQEAPSKYAIAGRYILSPKVFEYLSTHSQGYAGEIQLTDALVGVLNDEKMLAYLFAGKRYDCGGALGLLQANIDLAIKNPAIGPALIAWLANHPSLKEKEFA